MKTSLRILVSSALSLVAVASYAADMPPLSVSVVDESGKVVYRGKTKADGSVTTSNLPAGSYVVQFNSSDKAMERGSFALLASAGRKRTFANAVPGSQFTRGGAAMKLDVGPGMNINASVSKAEVAGGTGDAKTKIMNGKRYVWMTGGGIGSNMGGRWVEEGSAGHLNATRMSDQAMRAMRENQTPHQEGWKNRGTNY